MAKNYSSYSRQRKAIIQQVRRLEKRGYTVPDRYNLPTVKELRSMPKSEAQKIERRAKSYTTKSVRSSSYIKTGTISAETGEIKERKVRYSQAVKIERQRSARKAVETRQRKKKKPRRDLDRWAYDFIQAAPEDLQWDAEAYTEAVKRGYDKTFGEYLSDAAEQPNSIEVFNKKLEALRDSDAATAEELEKLFNNERQAVGEGKMIDRFLRYEGNLPEFDYHYDNGNLSVRNVLEMAEVITGKPLSGKQAERLRAAIDKDTGA